MEKNAILKATNLRYQIGERELLRQKHPIIIARNDLVSISGPSGGGKTTLLYLLSGLSPATSGKVHWGECDIASLAQKGSLTKGQNLDKLRCEWIGIVFQQPRLAKHLSGWENLFLPLKLSGQFENLDRALLNQLLEAFFINASADQLNITADQLNITTQLGPIDGSVNSFEQLDQLLRRCVSSYSSGQMQRIAIIRAILPKPKFIFADEILNSVEPQLQQSTWQIIKQICATHNIGFVLVSHNLTLLNDTCFSKKITVNQGQVICE